MAEIQETRLALTSAQSGMWFAQMLEPDNPIFNTAEYIEICGEIDLHCFETALRRTIQEVDSLHVQFGIDQDGVYQTTKCSADFTIHVFDVSNEVDPHHEAIKWMENDLNQLADLSEGPLFAEALFKISTDRFYWYQRIHHIVIDGYSFSLIARRVAQIYSALIKQLPFEKRSFGSLSMMVEENVNYCESKDFERDRDFWLKQFEDRPEVVSFSNHQAGSYNRYYRQSSNLSYTDTCRLRELAQQAGVNWSDVMIAAVATMLHVWKGIDDVILGIPMMCRLGSVSVRIPGLVMNILPLRLRVSPDMSLFKVSRQVAEEIRKVQRHRRYRHEQLRRDLKLVGTNNKLFGPVINIMPFDYNISFAGCRGIIHNLSVGPVEDICFNIYDRADGNGLRLDIDASTELYQVEEVSAHHSRWTYLIEQIVLHDFEKPIGEIDFLTPEEQQNILHVWGQRAPAAQKNTYITNQTIDQLFEAQVNRTPDKVAIRFENKCMTYRELNAQANQLARTLRSKGVKQGFLVGIMLERSMDMMVGILAILKAGGAYVPIDPDYPDQRITFMIEDTKCPVMLIHKRLHKRITSPCECVFMDDAASYHEDGSNLQLVQHAKQLAYIMYTSGTTGNPKGVMIAHNQLTAITEGWREAYCLDKESVKLLQWASFSFDLFTCDYIRCLLFGGEMIICPSDSRNNFQKIYELIDLYRVSLFESTPSMIIPLMEYVYDNKLPIDSLKMLIITADYCSMDDFNKLMERFGSSMRIINSYGVTEACVDASYYEPTGNDKYSHLPIGKPFLNVNMYILNHNLRLIPAGVVGELYIGGQGIGKGYFNRPELTAEKFVPNPFRSGEFMYRTGDLARWLPDGNIEFLGRQDHQVKIRGYRIEIGEVESAILQIRHVQKAIVILKEVVANDPALCAYFIASEPVTSAQMKELLSAKLPSYMVPSYFVQLEQFVLTPNGKIDRHALPPITNLFDADNYVAPQSIVEVKLAGIWKEVLGTENISLQDHFFELGGHSLKATILVSKIHRDLHIQLSVKEIFTYPTLKQMAEYIEHMDEMEHMTIPSIPVKEYYSLSSTQKRMYTVSQLEGAELAYNMPYALRITGKLDTVKLEAALNTLISRHESLRTCFKLIDGEIVQHIQEKIVFSLEISHIRETELDGQLQCAIRPFQLEEGPLFRAKLFMLEADSSVLFIDMHHIISDGLSMSILLKEWFLLYEGQELAPLRIQYKEYAVWQKGQRYQDYIQNQEAYWLERFAGEVPVLEMPTDYTRRAIQSFDGDVVEFVIEEGILLKLNHLAAQTGTTLYMVLLSVFTIMLSKYSEQEDIIVGTPIAGRTHAELEPIIGMFVNTLAIRTQPAGDKTYANYLQEVKNEAIQAFTNQDYPFEELVNKLSIKRDISRNPIFDVMFVLQNIDKEQSSQSGLSFRTHKIKHTIAQFDLTLLAIEEDGEMYCKLEFTKTLYKRATVQRMTEHFLHLIDIITAHPDIYLSELEMTTAAEKLQLMTQFNGTLADYPNDKTIHQLFEEQVARTPNHIAVCSDNQRLTYSELNERANQLAHALIKQGIGAGQFAGIYMHRSLEMMIGILGVLKSGAAYIPLDPSYPDHRIEFIMKDAKIRMMITQESLQAKLASETDTICMDQRDEIKRLQQESKVNPKNRATARDLIYVIYTSGTTGNPKGVMVEHRSVVNYLYELISREVMTEHDVVLQKTSISFDVSAWELFLALLHGAKIVMLEPQGEKDPATIVRSIYKNRITHIDFTPSMLQAFLDYIPISGSLQKISSLKYVAVGGEVLSPHTVQLFNRLLNAAYGTVLYNTYGPTETTVEVTSFACSDNEDYQSVPIGKAHMNMQLYVVNKYGRLQPIGVPGELCIGGDGLARGYLNNEDLTDLKFVDNPFAPGEKIYRTGDIVRWLPDGNMEFFGRVDTQVKIRGYRIELSEIESFLVNQDVIDDAAVMAFDQGDDSKILCAYYVSKSHLDANKIKKMLANVFPSYMIPSYFMELEQMPLTPNGKIDRKALPIPDRNRQTGTEYIPPGTWEEEMLVSVWQSVLGVEQLGLRDNFFEHGGDSIKSIQVSSRLYQFGYRLEMKYMLKYPTIEEVRGYLQPISKMVEQGEVTGNVLLTPIQHWLLEQKMGNYNFNQTMMLYRAERYDVTVLSQVMTKVIEHHDALRIVFRHADNRWEAWNRSITEGKLFTLEVFDLQGEKDCARIIATEASNIQSSMRIDQDPLVKLGLFQCQDGDHLLIVIHHMVIDMVSWRILFEDISTAYTQVQHHQEIKLPAKTDSYQSWAEQLSVYASSSESDKELAYWNKIEQIERVLLPKDYDEEHNLLVKDSQIVTVKWTERETKQLLTRAHHAYNTEINDLLLTALGMAIQDWTNHNEILINLEGHGRESIIPELDISRTIGWFTSQFPLALHMEREQNIDEKIIYVKEALRQIPKKGVGYGIIRYLSSNKDMPYDLNPEISFNYLGQIDQDLQNNALTLSPYASRGMIEEHSIRPCPIDINSIVENKTLVLTINFSSKQYRKDTVEQLAACFKRHLQEIVNHCVNKEQSELTPSDLTFKGMSIAECKQVVRDTEHIGSIQDIYPLTPMQTGMLFHNLMDADSGAYFEQMTFDMEGKLNVEALQKSFGLLVQRHEAMRTNVYYKWKGTPLQIVFKHRIPKLIYEDIREMNSNERERYIENFMHQEKETGFNLCEDVLSRISIFRTNDLLYRIVWSSHHIVMDGWCLPLIMNELFEVYYSLVHHKSCERPFVPPYSQYIEWLEGRDQEQALAYWDSYLEGYDGGTILPFKKQTGKTVPFVLKQMSWSLDKTTTQDLKKLANKYKVTLNTLMQTMWGILLQKYNDSHDVVFGSVVSGRPEELPGVESMIGLFINTIPVRVKAVPETTFTELIIQNQEQAISSHMHETCPLYSIQAQTKSKQDLISHIMVFESYPMDKEVKSFGGEEDTLLHLKNFKVFEQTNYDFTIVAIPGEEISLVFQYNSNVFEHESISRIKGHLNRLIEQVIAVPNIRIKDVEIITSEERDVILHIFNTPIKDSSSTMTIHQWFEEHVDRSPEQVAVVYEGQKISYQELNRRANRVASRLRREGLRAGQLVAVMAERSLEMLVSILGILKAGGAYVPIDPSYPVKRIRFILEDCKTTLLVTQAHLQERISFAGTVLNIDEEDIDNSSCPNVENIVQPHDLAYVMYTSGTTGTPKGVMIEHRSVVNTLIQMEKSYPFNKGDSILLKTNYVFDVSVTELFGWFFGQGHVVILSPGLEKDSMAVFDIIQQEKITHINFVPSLLQAMLHDAADHHKEKLRSLRYIFAAGEALPVHLIERFYKLGLSATLDNIYGPTEAAIYATRFPIRHKLLACTNVPIGKPLENVSAFILNKDDKLQPIGLAGELCIGGVGLSRGYLSQPDMTDEKFVYNSAVGGQRIYRTGDLARWLPDGNIEYLGRLDYQMKIRGYRIESGEVEHAIMEVMEVQSLVVDVHDWGNGDKALCAYFVTSHKPNVNELKAKLAELLPSYMIPTFFIPVNAIPLTSNGKIDRAALPSPDDIGREATEHLAPSTMTELRLVELWRHVLGVKHVGIKDDFFELGGHSLTVMNLVAQVNRDMEVRLTIKDVFENSTLEKMASCIEKLEEQSHKSIPVVPSQPFYPASSSQTRMYILSQVEGSELTYNMPYVMRLKGMLDVKKLERAFKQIIHRHDSFRTTFEMIRGELVQCIKPEVEFTLEIVEVNENEVTDYKKQFIRKFEMDQAPIMRAQLLKLKSNEHILMWDMHHIISDGVSMDIFVKELFSLYEGQVLPELRVQYKDFSCWRLGEQQSEEMMKQEQYWLETFKGEVPVLRLPTDFKRAARREFEGSILEFDIDTELCKGINQLASQSGCTLYMVLMAAYSILLSKYCGQEDIVIGTPIAARRHTDLEGIIGLFANTLAIRNFPVGELSFLGFLNEVKQAMLTAYENQDYEFEQLVEKLGMKHESNRNPLFDTMFSVQNEYLEERYMGDISVIPLKHEHTITKFDLSLIMVIQPHEGLRGIIEYSSKLFKKKTIELLAQCLHEIFQAIVLTPDIKIKDINVNKHAVELDDIVDLFELQF